MATAPSFQDLRRGAANTLALANKAALEVSDADSKGGLVGEPRREYHRLLQLIERAHERVDSAATPERAVWANKTAARALEQGLAMRKTLGIRTHLIDPLEDREDLCFYCGRDDQPPYGPVSVGGLEMRVCAGCQSTIVPWQTPTSEEMPRMKRSVRGAAGSALRSRSTKWGLPGLALVLILVVAVALFVNGKGRGPFAAASRPTTTPTPTQVPATPTPTAQSDTPPPTVQPAASTETPQSGGTPTSGAGQSGGTVAGGTALYQTSWRNGTSSWTPAGPAHWQVVNGLLTSDGSGASSLLAPNQPALSQNYVVQATVAALGLNDQNAGYNSFGLIVRATQNLDPTDQYGGDNNSISAGRFSDSNGGLAGMWEGIWESSFLDRSNFSPGSTYHTYRVEVRGTNLKLYVDNQLMCQTTDAKFLPNTRVGIFTNNTQLSVKDFNIRNL